MDHNDVNSWNSLQTILFSREITDDRLLIEAFEWQISSTATHL